MESDTVERGRAFFHTTASSKPEQIRFREWYYPRQKWTRFQTTVCFAHSRSTLAGMYTGETDSLKWGPTFWLVWIRAIDKTTLKENVRESGLKSELIRDDEPDSIGAIAIAVTSSITSSINFGCSRLYPWVANFIKFSVRSGPHRSALIRRSSHRVVVVQILWDAIPVWFLIAERLSIGLSPFQGERIKALRPLIICETRNIS